MKKAVSPQDWEAGRFYTKKSMQQIGELITILDECSLGKPIPEQVPLSTTEENEVVAWVGNAEANMAFLQRQLVKMTASYTSSDNSEKEALRQQRVLYAERMRKLLEKTIETLKVKEQ